MSSIPHPAERERRPQFWRVAQRCCQLAATVDVAFFFIFHYLGSPILAWVNVISVSMYVVAYYALKRRRNRLAIALIWTEVIAHAALGLILIGWESGFHYYLLMFIPALFASMPTRRACVAAGLLWLFYVGLDVGLWFGAPLQPISDQALLGVHLFNLTVVFAMFGYLSFFYVRAVIVAHRKLRRLATTDALTGLFNRGHMVELAEKEVARARRHGSALTFLLLDIDYFKTINDDYGHQVGDEVLVHVAQTLLAQVRDEDLVSRWGGEEFLIMLPGTELAKGLQTAERLRQSLGERPWRDGRLAVRLSASIGLSQYLDGESLSDCIARADNALYAGKEGGRNRVEVAAATRLKPAVPA
ncbi:MAG: diguanylate cyclase [Marinobacter sp.]|uniref:GGDEF domain-containing protein n=1 Tax=Marinobacter sp. TaxID=50741 RepID=UPI00299D0FE5|nr:diguanylate cyclase [Marinobacter sp.]MDX1634453.1 diguanylate cyclase [Marinobacter sp.]